MQSFIGVLAQPAKYTVFCITIEFDNLQLFIVKTYRNFVLLVFISFIVLSNVFLSCVSERTFSENPRITPLHKNVFTFPWKYKHVANGSNLAARIPLPSDSIKYSPSVLGSGKRETGEINIELTPEVRQLDAEILKNIETTAVIPSVTLSASNDNQPFLFPYSSLPDTTVSAPDSLKKDQLSAVNEKEKLHEAATGEKHPEYWAIASLASAILCLVLAIAGVPFGIILLPPIAAIVFGALGLKSSKRNMALAGLIIGIIELILLILLIVLVIVLLANWAPIIFI
jgi:hypothetical protein